MFGLWGGSSISLQSYAEQNPILASYCCLEKLKKARVHTCKVTVDLCLFYLYITSHKCIYLSMVYLEMLWIANAAEGLSESLPQIILWV
jgi:hypothetical protein